MVSVYAVVSGLPMGIGADRVANALQSQVTYHETG
jgi:hypothetical protein